MNEANQLSKVLEKYLYSSGYKEVFGQFETQLEDLREQLADGEIATKGMQKELSKLRKEIGQWIMQNYQGPKKADFIYAVTGNKLDKLEVETTADIAAAEKDVHDVKRPPIPDRMKRKLTKASAKPKEGHVTQLRDELAALKERFEQLRGQLGRQVVDELEMLRVLNAPAGLKKMVNEVRTRV